ncbi:hypothetical protein [Actinomadura sp. 9N407]|uniref:hypothetical protein n=1 Tax=Actinomadura sp. 9N407 TaxID=3375154 RepID=UPI0037A70CD9
MAEKLTPGALPEDWKPPTEAPAEPSRWADNGLPGGMIVDRHEHDVTDPGMYEAAEAPPRADVREGLEYQRAAQATGSPHVFSFATCTGCATPITYYGRADRMPDTPRCADCTEAPS